MRNKILAGYVLFSLTLLEVTAGINLFRGGNFTPVKMDGEETAAYGWNLVDYGRMTHNWWNPKETEYLSGRECFKLSFGKDDMTIEFLKTAPKAYFSQPLFLYNSSGRMPLPAAPEYRISGQVKLDMGSLTVAEKITLRPAENWQKFDLTVSAVQYDNTRGQALFTIKSAPGMKISFRDFRLETVYPASKSDAIKLPENGKLQRFVIPAGASFNLKYLAEFWRSWFWRLTGTTLPIVEGQTGAMPNSFAFMKGSTAPGGWKIKVDSKGGILIYGKEQVLSPALYDYIRLMDAYIFAPDCQKIPVPNADRILAAVDKSVSPRFYSYRNNALYGGIHWTGSSSSVDWYSWDHPIWDHYMNILLPVEKYRKDHPEYYMLTNDGNRQYVKDQFIMSPCLSNEDAKAIIERRFADMADGMDFKDRMEFVLGDRPDFCHCEKCRRNGEFYTDTMLEMTNRLARKIASKHPDQIVDYPAYLQMRQPPRNIKMESNVVVTFCLPPFNWPCNVHVECPENADAFAELKAWSKITGPDNLGAAGYEEARPWHHLRQMELLNRYAKESYYTFCSDPQIHYITGRWNLGDAPDKVIAEFNDAYYGAGGKYITQIQRIVEDFCEKYKHHPGEISSSFRNITVMSFVFDRKTILDRQLFDSIYPLLDRAFEAAKNDNLTVRKHLLFAKFNLMRMDLAKYRYTDCGTKEETAAFAKRLVKFIELCGEINSLDLKWPENTIQHTLMHGASARQYLQLVAGLNLPTTAKDWTKEPALRKFLEDPEKTLILEPVSIPGGIAFAPGLMRGGNGPAYYAYQCPRKLTKSISRPSSGLSELSVTLNLKQAPSAPLLLVMEGLDDDKPGASTMKIQVNGKIIFSGANTFSEHDWTKMSFTIPADVLKAGDNVIVVSNTVADREDKTKADNEGIFVGQGGKQDYQWGWICLSRLYVLDPALALRDYITHGKKPWTRIGWMNEPLGIVEIRDSTLHIESKGAPFTGVYFDTAKENRIAMKAGETIRGTVRGTGTGSFGFWAYDADGKYQSKDCRTWGFALKDKKEISFTDTLPVNSKTVSIIPFIQGAKTGTLIEGIDFKIIRGNTVPAEK